MKPLPHHYDVHLSGGPSGHAQLSTAGVPVNRVAPSCRSTVPEASNSRARNSTFDTRAIARRVKTCLRPFRHLSTWNRTSQNKSDAAVDSKANDDTHAISFREWEVLYRPQNQTLPSALRWPRSSALQSATLMTMPSHIFWVQPKRFRGNNRSR